MRQMVGAGGNGLVFEWVAMGLRTGSWVRPKNGYAQGDTCDEH